MSANANENKKYRDNEASPELHETESTLQAKCAPCADDQREHPKSTQPPSEDPITEEEAAEAQRFFAAIEEEYDLIAENSEDEACAEMPADEAPEVCLEEGDDDFSYASESTDHDENEAEDEDAETMTEIRTQEIASKFETLIHLLDTKHYADFRGEMEEVNPVDAADFFNELPPARIPAVFKLLKKDTAAAVFAELEVEVQERIITAMTDREISVIMEDLALDDAVDLVEELPANIVRRIMRSATKETRADINRFLSYPEDSAGSVMTAEFIDLRGDMTCAQAVAHIRKTGIDKETVYVAYVVDSARVLEGIVPLRALLFSSADDIIEDIMDPDVICASTLDDKETVAQTIAKYDMIALPIVDGERRLVGIVTVDDAMDVMETEATEDIEMMAAITPTDKPYLKTGVWETWRKRVPWLLLLMLSATFTSTILAHYESILDAATISLAVFVPMLTGTGGNASGQTSATIIRGLSLGEIEMRDIFRVLWKEIRVALVCGVTVAAACFVKTMLVDFRLQFTVDNMQTALVVCVTMLSAVLLAKIMGVLLPIGAKRVGFDPAVMASPFITTVVDTLTILIYVGIASLLLHI